MWLVVEYDRGYYYLRRRWMGDGKENVETVARYGKQKPSLYNSRLIQGESPAAIADQPTRSVGLVVTSPPYGHIKEMPTYDTHDEYIEMMNSVWAECYRLLDNGRRLVVNIADVFTSTETYDRYRAIPIHADIIHGCLDAGFDYMGDIIWRKKQTLKTSGGGAVMGSYPHPPEFLVPSDHEYILIFKKPGRGWRPPSDSPIKKASQVSPKQDWIDWYKDQWEFPGESKNRHSAPFPTELPMRLIRLFTFVGDIVLDPFGGSMTTPLVAMRWGRRGVGIDVEETHVEYGRERIEEQKPGGGKHYEWIEEWEWEPY